MIKENFKACFHTRNHTETAMQARDQVWSTYTLTTAHTQTHTVQTALSVCLSPSLCTALGFTFCVCLVYRCWSCLTELAVKRQILHIFETIAPLTWQLVMLLIETVEKLWLSIEATNIGRPLLSLINVLRDQRIIFALALTLNWLFETSLTTVLNITMYFQ